MIHSLSSSYVRSLLDILKTMGFDAQRDLNLSQFDPACLDDLKYRVPAALMTEIFNQAALTLDEPNIGLKTGFRFRVHTFNETGSVLAHVNSIAQAVEINRTYQPLTETIGICGLDRRSEGPIMFFRTAGLDEDIHRHIIDLIVTGYAVTTHWLGWSFNGGLARANFRHKAPPRPDSFEEIFQCPVAFGCEENFIEFAPNTIDRELPSYNPERLKHFCRRLDHVLGRIQQTSSVRTQVEAAIIAAISLGECSEKYVAAQLDMLPRALATTLRNEGLSFRSCVETVRKRLCIQYMRDGHSFTQIAQMLGYSDQSAFSKAFKRWYQVPPSKYEMTPLDY